VSVFTCLALVPLPVPDEVGRGPLAEGKGGQAAHLVPIGHAAVIFPPRGFLSVAEEVGAGDVVMVPGFGAAEAAEILLSKVRARAVLAVGLAVIDPLHLESGMQGIPARRFVGMDDGALGDAGLDEAECRALGTEHGRDGMAVALADDDDGLALAGLIGGEAAVAAALGVIRGLAVAAEIGSVDFGLFALSADHAALQLLRHGLAELVSQDESALVRHPEIAGERQGSLALHLVAEDRDGREIGAQRQLVRGEQGARGDAEILAAGAAAEAHGTVRAAALIGVETPAFGAHRSAIGLGPTDGAERGLGFHVRHAEHLNEAQGLGLTGEEEVLGHWRYLSFPIANEYGSFDRPSSTIYRLRELSFLIGSQMEIAKTEAEWQARASIFLKAKMKEAGVTYTGLVERLKEHGFAETEASVTMKLKRGTFAAAWLFACIAALELEGIRLEDL